jgi:hypothetical protein
MPQHAAKAWPGQNRRIRGCEASKLGEVETVLAEMRHRLLCGGRSDPGQQLENPEAGEGITWVFCPSQDCQQVLDMSGLDKLQPAIFDERDVTAGQLDLQPGTMGRRQPRRPWRPEKPSCRILPSRGCAQILIAGFRASGATGALTSSRRTGDGDEIPRTRGFRAG